MKNKKQKESDMDEKEIPVEATITEEEVDEQPAQENAETPADEQASEVNEEGLSERLLRLQADFDNFRRRTQKERIEWFTRANEDFIEELLPVLDHFEMGLNSAREHEADPAVVEGFKLVYDQLTTVLKKNKVTEIETENVEFNPHLHEAVTYMPSDDIAAEHIITQIRKGYMLGDKLLRPAQVVISSGPAGTDA